MIGNALTEDLTVLVSKAHDALSTPAA